MVEMYVTSDRALPTSGAEASVREVVDRTEVIDALYRFGLGQDLLDRSLFASAFAPDAELDFQPAATAWGGHSPLMTGRESIVDTILGLFTGRVVTAHIVTNARVEVSGDTARLTAIVQAQHLLAADQSQRAMLTNRYAVALVRDEQRWLMSHIRIDNIWYSGEPAVIFGG
jgi:hypothetical protein